MAELKLYNTLTRQKEVFKPIDDQNVRMYVCGPTVYDFAHIGNARPAIVFDVLFRLLRHRFGEDHVTYVRNITDVDDKINARALRDYPDLPLNEAIRKVTEKTANQYYADVKALGCLEPTHQPRATDFVLPREDGKSDMVTLIQQLLDKNHAYVATGREGREVLFDVTSMKDYGALSNRKLEDQQAGARIAVESHKKNPGDFVLWKESDTDQPGWDGTFTADGETHTIHGRPGWHIECSAMSAALLGETFDIHGGGLDLIFPHHENEIAQSCCAHGTDAMANIWMHNGYLQVEGKKMSKSDGNFVTIDDLLNTEKFGGRMWHGGVLRLALLKKHYREPIDFTLTDLQECRRDMERFYYAGSRFNAWSKVNLWVKKGLTKLDLNVFNALLNDLNTPLAISILREKAGKSNAFSEADAIEFAATVSFLNLMNGENAGAYTNVGPVRDIVSQIAQTYPEFYDKLEDLRVAITNDNQSIILQIESEFLKFGQAVNFHRDGNFSLSTRGASTGQSQEKIDLIENQISQRLALLAEKNFAEADRIRDELLSQGIQLKDSKDSQTGERITTWEVKR